LPPEKISPAKTEELEKTASESERSQEKIRQGLGEISFMNCGTKRAIPKTTTNEIFSKPNLEFRFHSRVRIDQQQESEKCKNNRLPSLLFGPVPD
jgi:hypothetical protein